MTRLNTPRIGNDAITDRSVYLAALLLYLTDRGSRPLRVTSRLGRGSRRDAPCGFHGTRHDFGFTSAQGDWRAAAARRGWVDEMAATLDAHDFPARQRTDGRRRSAQPRCTAFIDCRS